MNNKRWGTEKPLNIESQYSLTKKDVVLGGISPIMSHKNKKVWIISTNGIIQIEVWENTDKYGHLGEGLSLDNLKKVSKLQLTPGQTVLIKPLQVYRFNAVHDEASFVEIQLPDITTYEDVFELTKGGIIDENSSV